MEVSHRRQSFRAFAGTGSWTLLAAAFVFLQAWLNFQPFAHGTNSSFFFLQVDPELYSRDIVRTSTIGNSYFYPLMHALLGNHLTDPYFLFWPYLATCFLVAAAMVFLARYISYPGAGWQLILAMLVVQKVPINGAYLGLVSADYNYQHFALPLVLWALYLLLKERHLAFALVLGLAFYFHLKTPAAAALAMVPLVVSDLYRKPSRIWLLLPGFALVLPRVISVSESLYNKAGWSSMNEKATYMSLAVQREGIEGNITFNDLGITNLTCYMLLTLLGLWTVRAVPDVTVRRRIYLCHAGVYLAFATGLAVRVVDKVLPLGELVILGYSRASILGVALAMATTAVFLHQKMEQVVTEQKKAKMFLTLAAIFFIGVNHFYFAGIEDAFRRIFGIDILARAGFAIVAAVALAWLMGWTPRRSWPLWVLGVMLSLTAIQLSRAIIAAHRSSYPFYPFVVPINGSFDADLYEAQSWARSNTSKQDLFMAVKHGPGGEDFCNENFRNGSQRSVWCQDIIGAYGNAAAFHEWYRRQEVLRVLRNQPYKAWDEVLQKEGINYILSPPDIPWSSHLRKIFENNTYAIYRLSPAG